MAKEYRVTIGGLPHTVKVPDGQEPPVGGEPVDRSAPAAKGRQPKNKARTPKNKAREAESPDGED